MYQGQYVLYYYSSRRLNILLLAWWHNQMWFTKKWKWKSLSRVPMNYTIHGILQVRILEWVAFHFSRGSSQPRNRTQVSHIAGGFFTSWATREVQEYWSGYLSLLQWTSWSRNWTRVSCIAGVFFTNWATREACRHLGAHINKWKSKIR